MKESKGKGGSSYDQRWESSDDRGWRRSKGSSGWRDGKGGESHSSNLDRLLRKSIGWLNGDGGFENNILYNEVADASVGLQESDIKEVLDKIWNCEKKIQNPTAWICNALRKANVQKRNTSRPPRDRWSLPPWQRG